MGTVQREVGRTILVGVAYGVKYTSIGGCYHSCGIGGCGYWWSKPALCDH